MNFSAIKLVDLIEPSEILVDPIELIELCPVERPKVDLNDSTRPLVPNGWTDFKSQGTVPNERYGQCLSNDALWFIAGQVVWSQLFVKIR